MHFIVFFFVQSEHIESSKFSRPRRSVVEFHKRSAYINSALFFCFFQQVPIGNLNSVHLELMGKNLRKTEQISHWFYVLNERKQKINTNKKSKSKSKWERTTTVHAFAIWWTYYREYTFGKTIVLTSASARSYSREKNCVKLKWSHSNERGMLYWFVDVHTNIVSIQSLLVFIQLLPDKTPRHNAKVCACENQFHVRWRRRKNRKRAKPYGLKY